MQSLPQLELDDPLAPADSEAGADGGGEDGAGRNASRAAQLQAPPAPLEAVAKLISQSLAYPDSSPGDVR